MIALVLEKKITTTTTSCPRFIDEDCSSSSGSSGSGGSVEGGPFFDQSWEEIRKQK